MKIGVMFGDVFESMFKRPATERYPFERQPVPPTLRGQLIFDPAKCVGCALCVKECPSEAIELITIDKVAKRFVILYHVDRCTFCAQCVQNCRFKCLAMSSEQWELAAGKKEPFLVYYGKDEDIEFLLAKATRRSLEAPAED